MSIKTLRLTIKILLSATKIARSVLTVLWYIKLDLNISNTTPSENKNLRFGHIY